ncbi:Rep family protein [Enterococcus faecalis]
METTKIKDKKYRNMMVCIRAEYAPFSNSEEGLKYIIERLNRPYQVAIICHDNDLNDDNSLVSPHYHIILRFENAKSINSVAKKLQILPQYIEKWDKNYANGYSYLLHETSNSTNKHTYQISEVYANFDYENEMNKIRLINQVEKNSIKLSNAHLNHLIDQIKLGHISKREVKKMIPGFQLALYERKIEVAYQAYKESYYQKWKINMKETNTQVNIFWFYGSSGTGKTRYARMYANNLSESVFVTGSSRDPFQLYDLENIIILDELRPHTFSYDDLLKLLDPYNNDKMGASRYFDKPITASTIITSPYDPISFYNLLIKNNKLNPNKDSYHQLCRRLSLIINFQNEFYELVYYNAEAKCLEPQKSSRELNSFSIKSNKNETFNKTSYEKNYLQFYNSLSADKNKNF